MEADELENEIPLLIRKKSMKNIGIILDFKSDTTNIRRTDIPLYYKKSG